MNYLNTRPLLYGLERSSIAEKIDLTLDYPSHLVQLLQAGQIDLGLIPVAAIPELKEYHLITDYCIGTEGEIASVALFSEVPMDQIEKVYLDYQSRTSVVLLQYLMKEYWGISPQIVNAENEDYRKLIKGTTAGLVIGDRAFEQRKISTFIYDLGTEWRSITGLPFVFAVWISREKLPEEFVIEFNKANGIGLNHIDEIVRQIDFDLYDLKKYFNLHLSYHLDEAKRKSLELFLQLIAENR